MGQLVRAAKYLEVGEVPSQQNVNIPFFKKRRGKAFEGAPRAPVGGEH